MAEARVLKTMKLGTLVLDETVYPRQHIDMVNIRSIANALEAGLTIPPIRVDAKRVVVDGFNRYYALKRHFDGEWAETEIQVEVVKYGDRAALVSDAIGLNVGRGSDLKPWDTVRCVELAEENGIPLPTLAGLLRQTPERLQQMQRSRMARSSLGKPVALKNKIRHLVGEVLTADQEEAIEHMNGTPTTFDIEQLSKLLTVDLIPYDNHHVQLLTRLGEDVANWLSIHPMITEEVSDAS